MRFHAALVSATVVLSCGTAIAQQSFADSICPSAAQYVSAASRLSTTDPPQKVYDAAQAVTNAYERCSHEKLSYGAREPQHYADTRAAQFAVLAARALIAMNRLDDARHELDQWRPLAQQVVDWKGETSAFTSADPAGTPTTTNGDNRKSLYLASAREVVRAIDDELNHISAITRDRSRPQAKPSPAPSSAP